MTKGIIETEVQRLIILEHLAQFKRGLIGVGYQGPVEFHYLEQSLPLFFRFSLVYVGGDHCYASLCNVIADSHIFTKFFQLLELLEVVQEAGRNG